jgi:hypothetical protein
MLLLLRAETASQSLVRLSGCETRSTFFRLLATFDTGGEVENDAHSELKFVELQA